MGTRVVGMRTARRIEKPEAYTPPDAPGKCHIRGPLGRRLGRTMAAPR